MSLAYKDNQILPFDITWIEWEDVVLSKTEGERQIKDVLYFMRYIKKQKVRDWTKLKLLLTLTKKLVNPNTIKIERWLFWTKSIIAVSLFHRILYSLVFKYDKSKIFKSINSTNFFYYNFCNILKSYKTSLI